MDQLSCEQHSHEPQIRAHIAIEALSVAAEFLLCAVRAVALGADPKSDEVRKPVEWAMAKVKEAGG
ncbi:hypothetical protein J5N58_12200 [Rhizobium cremeum]|uniref:hypothetical protein n=1 Tax=Rhizobium cremeum TaxID=2813827 RepID=UPI000DDF357F|nr:hypothetical protein [Rhizobium cremeum]MCJ7995251.1 hypothetical protein [Rhizobium cremeum]MCJ8000437.1 hypothetical protein [Rhizobium cremeum]